MQTQHLVSPLTTIAAAPPFLDGLVHCVLSTPTCLQVVDLCSNQITRPGALAVAKAITKAKAGGAGAAPALELLALDENGISEAGIDQLKQLLKVCGCGALWVGAQSAGQLQPPAYALLAHSHYPAACG